MADTSAPHVTRVRLYRNGRADYGKVIVVNPRYYRNFESFLDTATWSTKSTNAVIRICTPKGRHNIDSVDKLADDGNYVAVGRERFKKLKYGEAKPVAVRMPQVWSNHLPSSGRFRKVYEGEKQALKRIFVYRNGDRRTPARKILLKKRTLSDMELVLAALQESNMNFDFAISKLFTINGKQVCSSDEIVNDGKYVALERGSRFKPLNYEGVGSVSPRNVVTRLPPIPTARFHQPEGRYSLIKHPPSIKQIPAPPPKSTAPAKQKKAKQTDKRRAEKVVVNTSFPAEEESILSFFDDDKRESFSHVSLSVTPPPLDESPDFTLSEHIQRGKVVEKHASSKIAFPSDLAELPEKEKESIGLELYNASGMQSEWGDMIIENRDTVTDKLIDDVPAEEIVDEDITETAEDSQENETILEKIIDTVKDKVSDDTPTEERVDEDIPESSEDSQENETILEKIIDTVKDKISDETPAEEIADEDVPESSEDARERIKSSESKRQEEEEMKDDEKEDKSGEGSAHEDEEDKKAEESPQQSRRSSEDMDSEDEVMSEDEEEDNEDDDDDDDGDDDDNDDEKSDDENEKSANEATDEKAEANDASNTEPSSESDEPATQQNKTNKKVEEQRADPEAANKNDIKQDNDNIQRKEKRVDNKA